MQTTQDMFSGLQYPELLKIENNFLCTILTTIRWNSLEWNQQKRDSLNSSWCPNQVIQWFYSELMVGNKLYLEIFLRSDIKAIQIWFTAVTGCQSSQYSKRPFTLISIGLLQARIAVQPRTKPWLQRRGFWLKLNFKVLLIHSQDSIA